MRRCCCVAAIISLRGKLRVESISPNNIGINNRIVLDGFVVCTSSYANLRAPSNVSGSCSYFRQLLTLNKHILAHLPKNRQQNDQHEAKPKIEFDMSSLPQLCITYMNSKRKL